MTVTLTTAAQDYLRVRRTLGYKLDGADETLRRFIAHVDLLDPPTVTIGACLDWVMTQGRDGRGVGAAGRLTVIRCFARYLHALDPAHQVPPTRLIAQNTSRPTPRLFNETEITALMTAARQLKPVRWADTVEVVIGVLWVTGMRVGEVLRLNVGDINFDTGEATVLLAKFGKTRLVPLDPTTIAVLQAYRKRVRVTTAAAPMFIGRDRQRLEYSRFKAAFNQLTETVGLTGTGGRRPRLHDVRHSFAVRTVLGWYQTGQDVHALLPRLSTYMGHVEPASTYWYLSAAPELMAILAARIDRDEPTVVAS